MTTPASSFDVIVIGAELAPLLAGALLAKRGFRVLVLGQDEAPPTYSPVEGLVLPRAPFNFLPASSPVARRVLAELALHQAFRRRATSLDPAFSVCMPRHRFELAQEQRALEREIEREFPEIKRPIEELLRELEQRDASLDAVLERDLVWPPETFFERRDAARAIAQQPFGKNGDLLDPLAELPDEHPFRLVVELPVRFAEGMDPDHKSGLRTTRLFSAWRRGGAVLDGGYAALSSMLLESIRTHSGEVREREKIDAVIVRRGAASGVRLLASGEEIGATTILSGVPLASLLRLVPDRAPFEELFERLGEPVIRYYRYTLNLVVRAHAVPAGMPRDTFFVRDPSRPLSDANALRIQVDPPDAEGRRVICVEALAPRRGVEDLPDYVETLRERVCAALGDLVPFLGDGLLYMDSPHDGRGVQDVTQGRVLAAPEPWTRGPATMTPVWGFPVSTGLGVCALPVRTPIRRLLLASAQIAPGLGLEGLFVAAWGAARLVGRIDRKKDWMRRGRWGKLEL